MNLNYNEIQQNGAGYLGKALRNNQVIQLFLHLESLLKLYHIFILQTITILELAANKIGDKGAQHLAEAIHNNQVTKLSILTDILIFRRRLKSLIF